MDVLPLVVFGRQAVGLFFFDIVLDAFSLDGRKRGDDHEHGPFRREQPVGVVVDLLATEVPDVDVGRGTGLSMRVCRGQGERIEADVGGRALPTIGAGILGAVASRRALGCGIPAPAERLGNGRLPAAAAPQEEHLRHAELGGISGQGGERAELPGDVHLLPRRGRFPDRGRALAAVHSTNVEAEKRLHRVAPGGIERADAGRPALFIFAHRKRRHRFELRASADVEVMEPGIAGEFGERRQPGAAAEDELLEMPLGEARIADGGNEGVFGLRRQHEAPQPSAIDERHLLERRRGQEQGVQNVGGHASIFKARTPIEVEPP